MSDNNATLKDMADEIAFKDRCYSLFERMINTVPSTVSLSSPITPMTWKAVDLALDVDSTGSVSLSGMIRNLYTTTAPDSVSYTTFSGTSGNSSVQTTSTIAGSGTSLFGNTTYLSLNTTIASPGTTSLSFEDISYLINDEIFVLPVQSTVNRTDKSIVIRAAALTSLTLDSSDSMMATFYVPTSVSGTITKQVQNVTVAMSAYSTAGNYTLYAGNVTTATVASVIAKVALGDATSSTIHTKLFSGGI
jgi:hypothetical protein